MNIEELSKNALLDMHRGIARVMEVDDNLPAGEKEFGVREYALENMR